MIQCFYIQEWPRGETAKYLRRPGSQNLEVHCGRQESSARCAPTCRGSRRHRGGAFDTVEAHYASLDRPHACYEGVVFIGHVLEDPGTGEEVEVIEAVPCRRCAEDK